MNIDITEIERITKIRPGWRKFLRYLFCRKYSGAQHTAAEVLMYRVVISGGAVVLYDAAVIVKVDDRVHPFVGVGHA